MRRVLLLIAAAVTLPGCSVAKPIGPIIDTPSPVANAPVTSAPAPAAAPIKSSAGTCDAANLAWLVGRSRNEIPVPVDPARRRVACTRCPVTDDYRPDRTDIRYDAVTGLVTSVKCG